MANKIYLAADLGAESGRVVAGVWNGKKIRLEEVHRFPNSPVVLADTLRWDVMRLWAEIQKASPSSIVKCSAGLRSLWAQTSGSSTLSAAARKAEFSTSSPRTPASALWWPVPLKPRRWAICWCRCVLVVKLVHCRKFARSPAYPVRLPAMNPQRSRCRSLCPLSLAYP